MLSVVLLLVALGLLASAVALRRSSERSTLALGLGLAGGVVLVAWVPVTGAYEVRKLVAALLMPVGLLWVGSFGVAWRATQLRHRGLATASWALWLGLTVAGNGAFGGALVGTLEDDYLTIDPLTLEPFDAVLVLGGGVTRTDLGRITLGSAGDRAALAARMYNAGLTDVLVTSGPYLRTGDLPITSMPAITARLWEGLCVPRDDIVLVEGPRSTLEEVRRYRELVAESRWSRVGLLTSATHLPRAMRLCRRHGLEVTPLPANLSGPSTPPRPRDLVPSSGGLQATRIAAWEYLGMLAGR